jgi:hypothetical protein
VGATGWKACKSGKFCLPEQEDLQVGSGIVNGYALGETRLKGNLALLIFYRVRRSKSAISKTTTTISSHDAGGTTTNTKAVLGLGGPKATAP